MFHISLSYIYIITKILIKINFFYKARNGIRTRVIFCLEGRRPKPLDHTCKKSRQRDLNPRHTAYKAVALPTVLYRHKQFSNMLRFTHRQFNTPTIVWDTSLDYSEYSYYFTYNGASGTRTQDTTINSRML